MKTLTPTSPRATYPANSKTNFLIDVIGSLQSWLDDCNVVVAAAFPESFRCVIFGPCECGNTFLLKNLIMRSIQFDILYIIDPTGNQYDDLNYGKAKVWCKTKISKVGPKIIFIKDIKNTPTR